MRGADARVYAVVMLLERNRHALRVLAEASETCIIEGNLGEAVARQLPQRKVVGAVLLWRQRHAERDQLQQLQLHLVKVAKRHPWKAVAHVHVPRCLVVEDLWKIVSSNL